MAVVRYRHDKHFLYQYSLELETFNNQQKDEAGGPGLENQDLFDLQRQAEHDDSKGGSGGARQGPRRDRNNGIIFQLFVVCNRHWLVSKLSEFYSHEFSGRK